MASSASKGALLYRVQEWRYSGKGGGGLMVSEITHIVTSQVPSGTSKPASLLRLVVVHYYYPGLCSHAETDRG